MLVYMHAQCGKPALRLKAMPETFAKGDYTAFLHVDGSPIKEGARMLCDACGAPLAGYGDKFPQRSQIKEVEE